MIRDRTLEVRRKLVSKLPITGEILHGSLLKRVVRHSKGCPKCERGEGHQVCVLTVSYPGGRTRQLSVRRERVPEIRQWLRNDRGRKAPMTEQLPGAESGHRGDLRAQPSSAASG